MKTLLQTVLLSTVIAFTSVTSAAAGDAPRTIRMAVDGLVCGFCAQGIDKQLRTLDATADVYVNLEKGAVAVGLKPGTDIDDKTLEGALTDAGYTLTGVTRSTDVLETVKAAIDAEPEKADGGE